MIADNSCCQNICYMENENIKDGMTSDNLYFKNICIQNITLTINKSNKMKKINQNLILFTTIISLFTFISCKKEKKAEFKEPEVNFSGATDDPNASFTKYSACSGVTEVPRTDVQTFGSAPSKFCM